MLTDWVLIQRLAREIEERLRGARVDDVGMLDDGRVALLFRRRGVRALLAADPFESPPLLTIEGVDTDAGSPLAIAEEPGFARALARSLRGMTLSDVNARRNDRLLRLRFSARSRFGVGDEFDLYAELVPRFGNLVLVKGERVVAALKEFAPSDNARRAIRTGDSYELPPLPANVRTIGEHAIEGGDAAEPLHVYRCNGRLLQAYVAPLDGQGESRHSREPSLLALFAELRDQRRAVAGGRREEQRRRAVLRRLEERERKLRSELQGLERKRAAAEQREGLRDEGERIFATLHELELADREGAKERATDLFAQYKKLGKSVPHFVQRERELAGALDAIETLRWEAERTGDEDLAEVESAVGSLLTRGKAPQRAAAPRRKRALLEFRTDDGSRIVVGRSPAENAEITFRLARPGDLWFHARGIPGAHVILARDDRTAASEGDVRAAAALAAFHSRAKASAAVPVDFTMRKHVRKQRAAAPGLVWYTHAKTIVAEPKATLP